MNILVTVDKNYIAHLEVMLFSLRKHHRNHEINVYLLYEKISQEALDILSDNLALCDIYLHTIKIQGEFFDEFPISDRYPLTMYYRLLAAQFLPIDMDRILYLDPDIVIINSLDELYHMEIEEYYFAAATHVDKTLEKINQVRLNYSDGIYINSGVLLMNLELLRKEQELTAIKEYVARFKDLLLLPDQDVLSALYANKVLQFDAVKYNMTERMWLKEKLLQLSNNLKWVEERCHIIHYIGRNKPWLSDYRGDLDCYYLEAKGFKDGYLAAKKGAK